MLYGVASRQIPEQITRALCLVALEDRRADLVSTFSGGMARRLEAAVGRDVVRLSTADDTEAARRLAVDPDVEVDATGGELVARVLDGQRAVPRLLATIDLPVRSVSVHKPTLDDVFLHFTGRQLRESTAPEQNSGMRRWMASRRRR